MKPQNRAKEGKFSGADMIFLALTAITVATNKATNNGSGRAWHVCPDMVRMRAWLLSTLEENKAYGPPESEGEIDSVN